MLGLVGWMFTMELVDTRGAVVRWLQGTKGNHMEPPWAAKSKVHLSHRDGISKGILNTREGGEVESLRVVCLVWCD